MADAGAAAATTTAAKDKEALPERDPASTPKPAPVDPDAALSSILLVQHEGDAGKLLDSVFDFLRRRTNFFRQDNARERALGAYERAAAASAAAPAGDLTAEQVAAASAAAAAGGGGAGIAAGAAAAAAAAAPKEEEGKAKEEGETKAGAEAAPGPSGGGDGDGDAAKATPSGGLLKPNAGRGADLATHSWTQTLAEAAVVVPLPDPPAPATAWRARDLVVTIGKDALRVGIKGQPPILDGPLAEPIKADDCLWNLVDGRFVELTLTKAEGMHWWRRVLRSDPEIDAAAVEPESSRLADLDGETRATVEKMMFDQRQKALGLPTSDEMRKEEILKQFMAAHPEMDFSGAKIM